MGKGEGEGVEVKDKVERVCSVILACRGCFRGVMACQRNPPLPRHPTHPHTHTYIHFHSFPIPSAPTTPLLACLITLLISSVIISLANKPCSHHPPTSPVLYPPAPRSPFLWSLSFDPHVSDFNCLWLFPHPYSPPWPFHLLIFDTSYLNPNLAPLPPQAKFCQCFLCPHLTPMPDAATPFLLRYFNCTHFLVDLICLQTP